MTTKQKPHRDQRRGFAGEEEGLKTASTTTTKPDFPQLVGAFDKDSMTAVVLLPGEVHCD